jgi:catechol 2,3-dioxygenase-like lactoylglutathione lyase family enzyme
MPGPLDTARTVTKLPAQDLDRARRWYHDHLGLEPVEERGGGLRYVCGATEFHLFESTGRASGKSTQMGFEVEDLASVVADLRERGITFERFEGPGFDQNEDGTFAVTGNYPSKGTGELGAFFFDCEGNLFGLGQATGPEA